MGSIRSPTAGQVGRQSISSLARAVIQTCVPFAVVITRTGWQPAFTVATTECAGSVSARRRLISVSVPGGSPGGIPVRATRLAEGDGSFPPPRREPQHLR